MPKVPQETTRPERQKKSFDGETKPKAAVPVIFIPGNVPSSKNQMRVWNGRMLLSKPLREWYKTIEPTMKLYKATFRALTERLEKPYRVEFKFVRKSRHRFDYPNPLQSCLDAMVKHGWIDDDNADEILPVFEPYEYDKEKPGVYITVLK